MFRAARPALALLLSGCVGATSAPAIGTPLAAPPSVAVMRPSLTQSEAGCTLNGVDGVANGSPFELTVTNAFAGTLFVSVWRIADDRSFAELSSYVRHEQELAALRRPALGKPSFVSEELRITLRAHETTAATATLRAGTYGIVCALEYWEPGEQTPDPGVDYFEPGHYRFAVAGPLQIR